MSDIKSLRERINLKKEMDAHANFRFAEMQKSFDKIEELRNQYELENGKCAIGFTDKAMSFYEPEFKRFARDKGYKWKYD